MDEYKERFLHLHKYAPKVAGYALKRANSLNIYKLRFQVKCIKSIDFLDAVAKVENEECMRSMYVYVWSSTWIEKKKKTQDVDSLS